MSDSTPPTALVPDQFVTPVWAFFELMTQPVFLFPFCLITGIILVRYFRKQSNMPVMLRAMGFGLGVFIALGGGVGTAFFFSEHIEYVQNLQ